MTTLQALEIAASRRNLVVERWQIENPKTGITWEWFSLGTREKTFVVHMDMTSDSALATLRAALEAAASVARGLAGDLRSDDVPLAVAAAARQPFKKKLYLSEVLPERHA